MERELAHAGDNWRERIQALQALLDDLRPRLVEAEAQLSERLAAINAFEYQVRARLESLSRRLDALEAEIDDLRRQLRRFQDDWFEWEDELPGGRGPRETWHFDAEDGAAAAGGYRYRSLPPEPPQPLEADQLAALKQLYRQLARRFHPDLALDEADREYRTAIMMAVNAAYAAGDLAELERLANEPDSAAAAPRSDEELAEALAREVERCERRLREIEKELATLERHDSARLMKRADRAAAEGRDLLGELAADLRRRIAEKMVERDVLANQLEEIEREGIEVSADDLADIVYNLGLEQAGEDSLFTPDREWRPRNRRRLLPADMSEDDDDILDDSD